MSDLLPARRRCSSFLDFNVTVVSQSQTLCFHTCILSSSDSDSIFELTVSLSARACLITSDLLVLILTFMKTLRLRKIASEVGVRTPLVTLLIRDGEYWRVSEI